MCSLQRIQNSVSLFILLKNLVGLISGDHQQELRELHVFIPMTKKQRQLFNKNQVIQDICLTSISGLCRCKYSHKQTATSKSTKNVSEGGECRISENQRRYEETKEKSRKQGKNEHTCS